MNRTRREFLADVAQGALIAGVGTDLASGMGLGSLWAQDEPDRLDFGPMEPLVSFLQEIPRSKLLPALVERLKGGTTLRELVAATALANARTFGGEDYEGFHSLMALMPSYQMSQEMPESKKALPVLKVIYRNVAQMHEQGGRKNEVLRPVKPAALPEGRSKEEVLREAVRSKDVVAAERAFAAVAQGSAEDALNQLLLSEQDASEVHRVVLTYRSYDLLSLVGREFAHSMLRQAVRYYVKQEAHAHEIVRKGRAEVRAMLPRLFDEYKLMERPLLVREIRDDWVVKLSKTILESTGPQAAGAVAEAIADGVKLADIHQALALAGNQLVLRDSTAEAHGNTSGVHCSDAIHAYRMMARAASPKNAVACTLLAAWHVTWERGELDSTAAKRFEKDPLSDARVRGEDAPALLAELDAAVRAKSQPLACAVTAQYGRKGHDPRALFDVLLQYAVSEDGALHSEKYYRTALEEFEAARPPFRNRFPVGLARYVASSYGQPAPGYAEALELLRG